MTDRNITGTVTAALAAPQVRALCFVMMDFPSGKMRVNNSAQDIDWDGYTWLGVGRVGSIDAISEGASLEARGLRFTISGVLQSHVSLALGQQYQGRDCKVWLALLAEDYSVLPDPVLTFSGRMDVMDIEIGSTATITISAESRLADWDVPRSRRYTHSDQQIDYPGDMGLQFVPEMAEKSLRWGY